jgi:enoyl-CoA hydratase/carnithine racemase
MAIIFECQDGIAKITLNRPEVLNAMDPATYSEITDAFAEIERNPAVRVAIITGAGDRAFTAAWPTWAWPG